jgi:hypothetical protein
MQPPSAHFPPLCAHVLLVRVLTLTVVKTSMGHAANLQFWIVEWFRRIFMLIVKNHCQPHILTTKHFIDNNCPSVNMMVF